MKPESSSMNDFFSLITPDYSFSKKRVPSPPDYGKKQFWAAIPGKRSVALLDPEKQHSLAVSYTHLTLPTKRIV